MMFFALAILLGTAKFVGELSQKFGQLPLLGEISAGVLLGPTVLGQLRPHWYFALFPTTGPIPTMIETVATLAVVLFLLAAGLKTNLRSIYRERRSAVFVSFLGFIIPFATGFFGADLFPHFLGAEFGANRLIFALFVGTALSISALPVIARILMDLELLQTEVGSVVMSAAMFDDLAGWILFGIVLGMMGTAPKSTAVRTIFLVVFFVAGTLTIGRWLIAKTINAIDLHTNGRGAVLGFVFTLTLAAAGFAEYVGIHAIFGAFIVALAIGDSFASPQFRKNLGTDSSGPTEMAGILDKGSLNSAIPNEIHVIVTNVFAPLFFATIGLHTNFIANFSLRVTIALIAMACLGKVLGASWGARLAGMEIRSSLAVGFAMNARGAMEIILGSLALRVGLIGERLYVGLVIMALFTSLISAPAIHVLTKPGLRTGARIRAV
jgi:Kef-type K+ transport system membrane component KefB